MPPCPTTDALRVSSGFSQDVIAAKAEGGLFSVATLKPRPEFAVSDDDIAETDPARGIAFIRRQWPERPAISPSPTRYSLDTGLNTLWSVNWIRQSGSQRIIGSSTTLQWEQRLVKPTGWKRWIARAR